MLHHHFHAATKGVYIVHTGCVLCQICFTGCALQAAEKRMLREKNLKKYLILNISKKQHYAGKTVFMNSKGYF